MALEGAGGCRGHRREWAAKVVAGEDEAAEMHEEEDDGLDLTGVGNPMVEGQEDEREVDGGTDGGLDGDRSRRVWLLRVMRP